MSLVKNVRQMQKNHIIFQFENNEYYTNIDNDNKLHIFNPTLMNIFLEQYEETIGRVTFHDIVAISTLENHDTTIHVLPNKLKHLTILSTMCHSFRLQGDVCATIETIHIDKSNIVAFPDIQHCPNLQTCKINHSAIARLDTYEWPAKLQELNLQANLLRTLDASTQRALMSKNKLLKINLSDNYLKYDDIQENLRLKCNLIRQGTYKHNIVNFHNVGNVNIQNFVQNVHGGGTTGSALLGSQNVHLSSINQSILASVKAMQEQQPLPIKKINLEKILEKNFAAPVVALLQASFDIGAANMATKLTYKQTFELIWSILCSKEQQKKLVLKNACERIAVEVLDGKDMCFTGKYNRLVNSMVGIIEGVQVGFSTQEQLQLEFERLLQKFATYTFEQLYCDAKATLEFTPLHLKASWMEAILDLAPEPEIWTYKNQQYYRTWDNDVLSLREKNCIGFYQEKEDVLIFMDSLV